MNIIDFVLLGILFVSAAFAVYRGSVASLLGLAACGLSLLFAVLMGPRLASALAGNQGLTGLLTTYTDAGALVGDSSLAATAVNGMSEATLEAVIKNVPLPDMLLDLLHSNLAGNAFAAIGKRTVNEYVTWTVVQAMLRAGSFVLCFLLCCLALHMVINLVDHVFYFPTLKHFELPLSAVYGLLRGLAILYVLFLLIPVIRTVIPLDLVERYIQESKLSALLSRKDLFLAVAGR